MSDAEARPDTKGEPVPEAFLDTEELVPATKADVRHAVREIRKGIAQLIVLSTIVLVLVILLLVWM